MGICNNMWAVENATTWLLEKLSSENQETLCKIAMVLWEICFFRNKRVWETKIVTPDFVVDWSSKQLSEWSDAYKRAETSTLSSSTHT